MVEREVAILKIAEVVKEDNHLIYKTCILYNNQYTIKLSGSMEIIIKSSISVVKICLQLCSTSLTPFSITTKYKKLKTFNEIIKQDRYFKK